MKLFVFMGVSGGGKSRIQHSLPLRFLTHYTTREVREGEIDGYHVKHVSYPELAQLEANQKLATLTSYAGEYYASPIEFIQDIIGESIPYHATATIGSVNQFKDLLGEENVVVFYIKPPSIEVLRDRMIARGDKLEDVDRRIFHIFTANELANEEYADYVIINDNLETAIAQVYTIIQTELGIADLERFREKKE